VFPHERRSQKMAEICLEMPGRHGSTCQRGIRRTKRAQHEKSSSLEREENTWFYTQGRSDHLLGQIRDFRGGKRRRARSKSRKENRLKGRVPGDDHERVEQVEQRVAYDGGENSMLAWSHSLPAEKNKVTRVWVTVPQTRKGKSFFRKLLFQPGGSHDTI